jgi:branched-chain amino acid transport system permease protein
MALVLQQLINGLTLGAVYGLIAIGYTMVYGIIGMINFAHGDIYMVSAFIAVTAFTLLAALGVSSIPLALPSCCSCRDVHLGYGWAVERTPTARCAARPGWRR